MPKPNNTDCLPEDRDGFRFRGGSCALDLAATMQARRTDAPRELLQTPADLDRWLVSCGVASAPPGAGEADLETARALRESIYAIASTLDAPSLDEPARAVLNRIAAGPAAAPSLTPEGRLVLQGSARTLLTALARDAVHLFASEAQRIRQCESANCSIFFIDTSRSGRRRWCSMAACGNKAKVAALRSRARAQK